MYIHHIYTSKHPLYTLNTPELHPLYMVYRYSTMGTADGRRPRSDPLIKVFDLRMMRQIAPLQLYANRGPPPLVSFLPQFSSSLVIAKPDAQLQVTRERVTR